MNKKILNNKKILITGGTGSFGKSFVNYLYSLKGVKFSKIVVFSRDELKQYDMQNHKNLKNKSNLRFLIGDIRDYSRLEYALKDIDYVIHAAALKQVPAAEYNPYEYINTNINGAENLIRASINNKVKKIIALSTDKAAAPINLYGATKLCSDKLFVAANNIKGHKDISFSVVRYGNVMFSRGSVLPTFLKQKDEGQFTITHKDMTRFTLTLKQSVEIVMWALMNSKGSEILVPKIPSYKIIDVAKAINPKNKIKIIGLRSGEKLHEEMITLSDSYNTYDLGKYYAIIPKDGIHNYKKTKIKKVKKIFNYNSKDNKYLSVNEIKKLINEQTKEIY
jgi:UDP-N-acetylglucosamine 4,6-dehydratase/5-epimerase